MTLSPPSSPPIPPSERGPYSGAVEFDANMAIVLAVLVCATALTFALHGAFRLLQRRLRGRTRPPPPGTGKPLAETEAAAPKLPGTVVVFAAGTTAVTGAPECAICLAELAEGERVRLIPGCGHGFHAQCVDAWLAGRSSCPTCRGDWLPPAVTAEP